VIKFIRTLWHRIVPIHHLSPAQQALAQIEREQRAKGMARIERAIRANRLTAEDGARVRREFAKLAKLRGPLPAIQPCVDFAATLAPDEQGRSW